MTGKVRKLQTGKTYGFIKTSTGEYFFHRESFDGHWDDLVDDSQDNDIEVEFEPKRTEKGLRAEEVSRIDR